MTAAEIRKFTTDNIAGRVDGSLDENQFRNALLGEIAAQLAEMNERADPDSGRAAAALLSSAYKKLRAAGDAICDGIDGMYAKGAIYPDAQLSDALKVWRELNR